MRKGRCSNEPKNCTLALNKTELPYAGMDSICPECGSPLAAMASPKIVNQTSPSEPLPSPQYTQNISSTAARDDAHRYDQPPPVHTYQGPTSQTAYDAVDTDRKDGAMKLTQIVIFGAAIALIGFFAWRMFLQPRAIDVPQLESSTSITQTDTPQVTQISPAQLRRLNVTTQALSAPNASGQVIAMLAAGSVLDVTGQVQVNGISWFRVSLPNDSSKSGFIREDQMANLGDSPLILSPTDPLSVTISPSSPSGVIAPEIAGPIQPRDPTTFYIASRQANIRQEANVSSSKVGTFEFIDPITVVGQRTVGNNIWYQVQLPSGGLGWINGRLISNSPRPSPIDGDASKKAARQTDSEAQSPKSSGGANTEIGKADNQAALTAVGPGTTMRVDASNANLRKEPGATGNSVVEVLQRDTLMTVEDVRILNGVPWYLTTSPNGAQGWVSGRTIVPNN